MRYEIIDRFLTKKQCTQLIDTAIPRFQRAGEWDSNAGETKYSNYRTADQMFFARGENELVTAIEDKISKHLTKVTGKEVPVVNGEGMQVLRYSVGGHYYQHYDWFDSRYPRNMETVLKSGGQRILTMIMYLNTCPKGGDTYFPKMNLRVKPKQGRALWWWNVDPLTIVPAMDSIHTGEDVQEGFKFILTKWVRQYPYYA